MPSSLECHSSTLIFYIEGGHRKTTSMRKKTLVKKLLPIFNSLRTTHTTCCFIFSIAFYIHGWRLNALILVRNPIKHIFLPLKPCLSTKYIFQAVCTLYTKGSKSLNCEYNVPLILQKIWNYDMKLVDTYLKKIFCCFLSCKFCGMYFISFLSIFQTIMIVDL